MTLAEIREVLEGDGSVDRSLFEYDSRRAIAWGWSSLAIICAFGFASAEPHHDFSHLTPSLIFLLIGAFTLLADSRVKSVYAYLPQAIFLLVSPLLFETSDKTAWISYGLLSITMAVYASSFRNIYFIIFVLLSTLALQLYIAHQELPSISDNRDMLLAHTYFSTSWYIIVGVGCLAIKYGYLRYFDTIEKYFEELYRGEYEFRSREYLLNSTNHLNSIMHGTILNTLIAVKSAPDLLRNRMELARFLRLDLMNFYKAEEQANNSLENKLKSALTFAAYTDVKFNVRMEDMSEMENAFEQRIIEVAREIALNHIKHLRITEYTLTLSRRDTLKPNPFGIKQFQSEVDLAFEYSLADAGSIDAEEVSEKSMSSRTLARLLEPLNGSVSVNRSFGSVIFSARCTIPGNFKILIAQILQIRRSSLMYIARAYISMSLIFGVVALPMFYFVGLNKIVIFILGVQLALTAFAVIQKRQVFLLSTIGSGLGLIIFPLLGFLDNSCNALVSTPWLFNSILGSTFFLITVIKTKAARWIPALIFFLSLEFFSSQLPAACNQLMAGSTPAIVMIAIISISLGRLREKNEKKDTNVSEEIGEFIENRRSLDKSINLERTLVIQNLETFVNSLEDTRTTAAIDELSVELEVRKLRSYLIASEYFMSPLVVEIYRFVERRLAMGKMTFLEILTSNFQSQASASEVRNLLRKAGNLIGERPMYLTVTGSQSALRIICAVENWDGEEIQLHSSSNLEITLTSKS